MNCRNFAKKIVLHLYGELSEKETARLNRHIDKCNNCRLELEELRKTIKTFQQVEMPKASPACEETIHRLARENLTVKTSWINRAKIFPEIFAFSTLRPIATGLGMVVLLLALSFYFSHEKVSFPFRWKTPGETEKITKWENGTDKSQELLEAEAKILEEEGSLPLETTGKSYSLDDNISDLKEDVETMKWVMQTSESNIIDWEIDNLEEQISNMSSELNNI